MIRIDARDSRWRKHLTRRRSAWRKGQALVTQKTRGILDAVRVGGDQAILRYTSMFDGVDFPSSRRLRVSRREIEAGIRRCDAGGMSALRLATERIERFHRANLPKSISLNRRGEELGQRVYPIARVGLYVPGGRAVYPSTVLMAGIPARIAGVPERVMCTPPDSEGHIDPWVLAAADLAGITEIYRVGGVQAIGAMAYGTERIRSVDKIVGPGNAYVAAAKRIVFGEVGIDQIAGPSELLIVADNSARPDWVAADLLAQAEHDPDALLGLVLIGKRASTAVFVDRILCEVKKQLKNLLRRDIAKVAWRRNGMIIETSKLAIAAQIAAEIQPEHLSLVVRNGVRWVDQFACAGAVFIGGYSPVAAGDYVAGPNHVLPTGGSARFSSPLGVEDFMRRTSVVSMSKLALESVKDAAAILAGLEGLDGHAHSLNIRFPSRGSKLITGAK